MDYALLKSVHITCAVLSGAGFLARAAVALRHPLLLRRWRAARVLPHAIHTLLLVTAVSMVFQWSGGFAEAGWLHAKIALLLLYIGLGTQALSPRRSPQARAIALLLACACFALIVASALTKTPFGLTG